MIFKEISSNEEKRKLFRIERFKNNFMKEKNKKEIKPLKNLEMNNLEQKLKLKKIFMNSTSQKTNEILTISHKSHIIPFIFNNTYNEKVFKIQIQKEGQQEENDNDTILEIIKNEEELLIHQSQLEENLSFLPNTYNLPEIQKFHHNTFSREFKTSGLLFFTFFTLNKYKQNIFFINFLDDNSQLIFSTKIIISTVPPFISRNLNFYELEKTSAEIKIDLKESLSKMIKYNKKIKNNESQKKNKLFIISSLETISIELIQKDCLSIKTNTSYAPNIKTFNLFIYESPKKIKLLENIKINLYSLKTIELIPEPGISKGFELLIPSENNRLIKINSTSNIINFPKTHYSLTSTSFNKIIGNLIIFESVKKKVIVNIIDEYTEKKLFSYLLFVFPKEINYVRVINETILKRKSSVISFNYFNKKSIFSKFKVISSNKNILKPIDEIISIEGFQELNIKFKTQKNFRKNKIAVNIFVTEVNNTVNDCFKFILEFVDR